MLCSKKFENLKLNILDWANSLTIKNIQQFTKNISLKDVFLTVIFLKVYVFSKLLNMKLISVFFKFEIIPCILNIFMSGINCRQPPLNYSERVFYSCFQEVFNSCLQYLFSFVEFGDDQIRTSILFIDFKNRKEKKSFQEKSERTMFIQWIKYYFYYILHVTKTSAVSLASSPKPLVAKHPRTPA